jgi:HK97 family phage prohead protease
MRRKQVFTDSTFAFSGDGPGRFAGYAVTYDKPLRMGDVVRPGAFDETMDQFIKEGALVVEHGGPRVGYFDVARSDQTGVWVEGFWHSTPDAQAQRTIAAELVAAGHNVPTSVGFAYRLEDAIPVDPKDRWGAQVFTKGELFELALVGRGNDPAAQISQAFEARDAMTFADQSESVLAAVEGLITRAREINALRLMEGRVLSTANLTRLTTHADALEQACADIRGMVAGATKSENNAQAMVQYLMSIEGVLARAGGN